MNSTQNPSPQWLNLIALALVLASAPDCLLAGNLDDFNDSKKAADRWGADRIRGRGVLAEQNQNLQYTCSQPSFEDSSDRPWILTRFPANAAWEIQIDVSNDAPIFAPFQVSSMGINLLGPRVGLSCYAELYHSSLGGLPGRKGFASDLQTDDVLVGSGDSSSVDVATGAVRFSFTGATKVLTASYDANVSDGYQWVPYASFGLAGAGGDSANTNWQLAPEDQISAFVYGYSAGLIVGPGQMFADNFREEGGVTPSGAATPEPVGSFRFAFPSDNPLLTRIVSLVGNYQGTTHTSSNRAFNVDVAQDESGKLSAMGTMDGVLDRNGSPELAGSVGTVATVNGEPTAQLKTSFTGSRDGQPGSGTASAAGPVELVDIGGGTNGLTGTASYRGKIGLVPYVGNRVPLRIAVPPEAASNLRHEWSLKLEIYRKSIKGTLRTVGTGELLLPNGDTLQFPERVIRYSSKNGYALSLQRGTNITANPVRIDRKSAILIKGLTFERQADTWQPTGGVISYRFLGQRGVAPLLDFLRPPAEGLPVPAHP